MQHLQGRQESALQFKRHIPLSSTAVEAPCHYYWQLYFNNFYIQIFSDLTPVHLSKMVAVASKGNNHIKTYHLSYLVTCIRTLLCAFGVWWSLWGGEIQVALLWLLLCGHRRLGAIYLHTADFFQDVQWVTGARSQTGHTNVRKGRKCTCKYSSLCNICNITKCINEWSP